MNLFITRVVVYSIVIIGGMFIRLILKENKNAKGRKKIKQGRVDEGIA